MSISHWTPLLALTAALAATPALAQQQDMAGHAMPMPSAPHNAAPHNAANDMMAGMAKMNHDMTAAPMTGNTDRDFVAMMIPHHQGAVDMAQVELRDGKDPAIRRLASDIVAAQKKEIAMMKHWQATHPGH